MAEKQPVVGVELAVGRRRLDEEQRPVLRAVDDEPSADVTADRVVRGTVRRRGRAGVRDEHRLLFRAEETTVTVLDGGLDVVVERGLADAAPGLPRFVFEHREVGFLGIEPVDPEQEEPLDPRLDRGASVSDGVARRLLIRFERCQTVGDRLPLVYHRALQSRVRRGT
ncbi:hypothetical protein BRD04_09490 [Halobacteriales archaeon QS_9_67_17]|nr:MAG: hypothetical protein BRD04_09490 [Halobacteriales archaeon QS_9_67_17]